MQILVLGGTRYFGKRLVELLLKEGHHVTVATRGIAPDSFGKRVERRKIERSDPMSMRSLALERVWDVVVDQVTYCPNDAQLACEVFAGRVGRYVHTSTASVYSNYGTRVESDFNPHIYSVQMGQREAFDYGEGKRLAEAVYFQRASFPVVAMRIPIVLGSDDYTKRLEFHIDRIRDGKQMVIPNMNARTSFISSSEAARFLAWLVKSPITGPVNAASLGDVSIQEIVNYIEDRLGKKAVILPKGLEEESSPFTDEYDRILCSRLAASSGFQFESLHAWLPTLINSYCLKSPN